MPPRVNETGVAGGSLADYRSRLEIYKHRVAIKKYDPGETGGEAIRNDYKSAGSGLCRDRLDILEG